MTTYQDFTAALRRLLILQALAEAPAFTSYEPALRRFLDQHGYAVSRQDLHSDLQLLTDHRLVHDQNREGMAIVTLTAEGDDVRQGLTTVPGIANPEPK